MTKIKRIQLGLLHVAVAMTLVPINSTLNRVMIKELGMPATLVAVLASLPFLLAPIQMVIGSHSDRHPFMGRRRTPYIAVGLLLCAFGVAAAPQAAFLLDGSPGIGLAAAVLCFGAWGMGYNLSSVSYLSLATELSGEDGRGKTIAVMWFMMILGIILTAIGLGHLVDPYSPAALSRAFAITAALALVLGAIGLYELEPRSQSSGEVAENYTLAQIGAVIAQNPVARTYFVYLLLLLAAILGQDVLLEPFAAEAFGMSVVQTTRITSVWGTMVLAAIAIAGALEGRTSRRSVAHTGNIGALIGLLVILSSGLARSSGLFYGGVMLLGVGTGLSTVANLALMFELTIPGQVGLYMGAWGFSNALSRLTGSVMGGAVRDVVVSMTGDALRGYLAVIAVEAAFLLIATWMLGRMDLQAFKHQAVDLDLMEVAAVASDG